MKEIIKKLLLETIKEYNETTHLFDRLTDRINKLSVDEVLPSELRHLTTYLKILRRLDFNPKYSYALRLMQLDINPESKLYLRIGDREYYRIDDFLGHDSTGNEIWLIVRDNEARTIMLRKDIQPESKLRVDYIVNKINDLQELITKGLVKETV